jgi:hypothetical protein
MCFKYLYNGSVEQLEARSKNEYCHSKDGEVCNYLHAVVEPLYFLDYI